MRNFKLYSVRPYHGYDCNSDMGFNNGCYTSTIDVYAANPDQARVRAMARFRSVQDENNELKRNRAHDTYFFNNSDSVGFYLEYNHVDEEGNKTIPEDAASYRYEFVSFDDVTEKE